MNIIPAIDLKDGKCVRLLQGRKEDVTVYSDNPAAVARQWESIGAPIIHIVDLDGAFTGQQRNIEAIRSIREAVRIPLQFGGGIRDIERIRMMLSLGIDRVIIGTAAVENPDIVRHASKQHPERILVGIDAVNGYAAVKGWVEVTTLKASELARRMQDLGAAGIIYTDISKDGMLTGPNIESTADLVSHLSIPVIASGGISNIQDIRNLKEIKGLWGAITGKALYSGALDLAEAIRIASL